MKKLIFFLIVLIFNTLLSCSSDNNTPTPNSNSNPNPTPAPTPAPTPPPPTSVTDIDGNSYELVTICNQIWTKSNLNVSKYRNGDIIPQITNVIDWYNTYTGAWCYYANTTSNGTTYGKLYNWYAVNDVRGLAPAGYHIPSQAEWETLFNCLGGELIAGGKMKATGTTLWLTNNIEASNISGFSALPGGILYMLSGGNHIFAWNGSSTQFWSSTVTSVTKAYSPTLWNSQGAVTPRNDDKRCGFSVRLIKD